MKKAVFYSLVGLLFPIITLAQPGKDIKNKNTPQIPMPAEANLSKANVAMPTVEPLAFVTEFYEQQNAFSNGNFEAEPMVGKKLNNDFLYIRNAEDVRGLVRTVRFNRDEYMREMKATKGLNIRTEKKVHKVIYSEKVGNLANVSIILSINFYKGTELVASTGAFVSHSLTNEGGIWQIRTITADRVVLSQNIGICGSAVVKQAPESPEAYQVKVSYPNGDVFEEGSHVFTFKGEGSMKIISVDNVNYYTLKEGTLYSAKIGDSQTVETLGKANNSSEAIALILSKSLYSGHCYKFESIR